MSFELRFLGFNFGFVSELSLKLFKKVIGTDSHFGDLNTFKPDSPALERLLELFSHGIFHEITFFEDIIELRVSNQVSEDTFTHGLDILIGVTALHVLVALEGSIVLAIDGPEGYTVDVDTLHFESDVVSKEGDSLDPGGVSHDGVPGSDEGFKADSGFDEMTVSDDYKPLIGLRLDPEAGDEVGNFFEDSIENGEKKKSNNEKKNVGECGN